jgi:pimeloyl-ACP methyl ester carboxylesterase
VPENDPANQLLPVILTVPCFSGAPWDLDKLRPLSQLPLKTMRLPDGEDDIEAYADFVGQQAAELECYVLVGDSFGALISLAFATRRPYGLRALVMSGGFAANPIRNRLLKARIKAARFLPGVFYRKIVLRMHAASLSSPYDAEGQVSWAKAKSRQLFEQNTPHRSYVARANAALRADYLEKLSMIQVPTLIITPSYDNLIGDEASRALLNGIPNSQEVVLARTGHMVRYTHPITYGSAVYNFLMGQFGEDFRNVCR